MWPATTRIMSKPLMLSNKAMRVRPCVWAIMVLSATQTPFNASSSPILARWAVFLGCRKISAYLNGARMRRALEKGWLAWI